MNNTKSCDYCLNYDYDEETGEMVCNVNVCMDEDDYARIYAEGYKACPYFMINNEYKISSLINVYPSFNNFTASLKYNFLYSSNN